MSRENAGRPTVRAMKASGAVEAYAPGDWKALAHVDPHRAYTLECAPDGASVDLEWDGTAWTLTTEGEPWVTRADLVAALAIMDWHEAYGDAVPVSGRSVADETGDASGPSPIKSEGLADDVE